ncbi:MAG: MarC family protein [Gammaproteobacteria bacterium]|nr:MarC family protein [Gammaproteobacteria bacterium]
MSIFTLFFAVIDPVGTMPVFIAVTSQFDEKSKRKIALQATLFSAFILVFFIVAGEAILHAIGIPLRAVQVAGGIILFLFALSMIFGESKPDEELKMAKNGTDTSIFPLAVPSIASPGAMLAAVLLTDNTRYNIWEQVQTAGVVLFVLLLTLVLMLISSPIIRFIGLSGASVISRVMGMILASVAANNVLSGIKIYYAL